jgi:drug/metabolite transporter (DMT)-like permease
MATSPVFITLGAVLFLKESWNRWLAFSLLLSLIGVLFVITQGSLATFASLSFNVGDLLFIGALCCWVGYGLIGKVVMRGVSPLFTTAVTTVMGFFFLAICSFFEHGWGQVSAMSPQSWLEMVYMTVFATVLAFFLWNQGVSQIGASNTSMYMNLVPLNAAWIAVVFYGSSISMQQVFGMVLVIAGVYLMTRGNRLMAAKQKQPDANTLGT